MKNSSDRYDHDMTAERFLAWLRLLRYGSPTNPTAVKQYLYVKGYNVVDVCYDTVVLVDMYGGRWVRVLPATISRALRDVEDYPVLSLVEAMEARI